MFAKIDIFLEDENNSHIKNLTLTNTDIIGKNYVGALCGYIHSSCYRENTVKIDKININNGTITGHNYVGGIIGKVYGDDMEIQNPTNYSKRTIIINKCYSSCTINANNNVGGICNMECFEKIINSKYTGTINGNDYVGGIAGIASYIKNCYSIGTINGNNYVGGIAGMHRGSSLCCSYAYNTITGSTYIGGITGIAADTYTNSFYLNNNTDFYNYGGIGLDSLQMKNFKTYYFANWDFAGENYNDREEFEETLDQSTLNMWKFNKDQNNSLPFLAWENFDNDLPLIARVGILENPSVAYKNEQFKSKSIGNIATFEWDFNNDGIIDSNTENPVYIYTAPGHYTVKLTVSNNTESDTHLLPIYVSELFEGEGTYEHPFLIGSLEDLIKLEKADVLWSKIFFYDIVNDIDARYSENLNNATGFNPIGNIQNPFKGTINGNNHSICNFVICKPNKDNIGLLGVANGSILNLKMIDVSILGKNNTGVLAGFTPNAFSIKNCYVTGGINNTGINCGGFIGKSENITISESFFKGNIGPSSTNIGGLVGFANQNYSIANSFAKGTITATDNIATLVYSNPENL